MRPTCIKNTDGTITVGEITGARALWAVHVLDNFSDKYKQEAPGPFRTNDPVVVSYFMVWNIDEFGVLEYGATPDAARIIAAEHMVKLDPALDAPEWF